MKLRWYHWYTVATFVVALGLSLLPQYVKYDESPLVLGQVDSYRNYREVPAYCHQRGAPASYEYRGWPLVSHGPNDECRTATKLFVGNTAINTIIASGATAAAWLIAKQIRQRSVR